MKKITLFVVAMFVALTTFAADIAGGTKFFLDLRTPSSTIGKNNGSYKIVFTNGDAVSDTITLAYNGAKIYRFAAPEGTWTGIKVIPAKSYYMHLTYDGTNNYFAAAKNPKDALTLVDNRMVYVDTDGTWSKMPVVDIVGGTKFYIDLSQNSTCKQSKYFPTTVKFASFDGATESEAVTVEYNAELADVYEVVAPEGTWSRIIFQQKSLSRLDLTYDGVNNLFTLNKTTSQASLLNMDGSYSVYINSEGVWSKAATPIEAGQVFYLDPTANEGFVQTFDAYKAVFVNAEGTYSAPVEMTKVGNKYKVVAPEGTWVSFDIDCYLEGEAEATISGLVYDGENTMFSVDAAATATAITGTWGAPRSAVEATWNIAEGDTLEFFKEVRITFAGYDSVGRKFVGATATDMFTEVTNVVLANGSTLKTFFSVDEEGNTTPVPGGNGVLYSSRDGLTCIFSINTKGYEENEQGFYAKGNYRIVLPGCSLQCAKARTGMPKVYLEEDYVLNFTIDNNYVKKTAVSAQYEALPANEARLQQIREVVLTFPQYDSVFVNETSLAGNPYTTVDSLATIPGDDLLGTSPSTTWAPAAPMQWAAVEGVKNAVRFFIPESMFPAGVITDLGDYRIIIPEGVITLVKTDDVEQYNKEFTLNYSIVNPTLTVNVNDPAKGSVDVATGEYAAGTVVTLTATPAEGYKLLAWSDRSTENTLTVTMDGNKAVTAYFVKDYPVEPTFTMEKVWETTITEELIQGVGRDGVFYLKDRTTGKIQTLTKDGLADFAENAGAGSNIAMDEAGNLITCVSAYPGPTYNTIMVYQKGSNVGKEITFEFNSARQDFFSASGDIFSAEGGYVYFYCNGQTVVNRIKIANGEFVATDEVGANLGAGSTRNHVMLDIFGNLVAHPRSGVVNAINFTTGASTAFTLPNHKKSTLGGCSFELGGKEFWAYNVGATNYNSEWNLYNYTDGKFLSETALTVNDDDYTTNGAYANWLDVQVVEDTAFIYHYCPKVGAAVWKVTFTADPIEVTTMEELKAHEGERVLYRGLEPAKVTMGEGMMAYTEYFMPDSVTALNHELWPLPAKMDVFGTLTEEGFTIDEVVNVYAFYTFSDLQMYFEEATAEQKAASYEIVAPFTVTLVNPRGFYYVQYEYNMGYSSAYLGMMVQAGGGMMPLAEGENTPYIPTIGDQIRLKGSYVPAFLDEEGIQRTNAMFMQETATLVSQENEIKLFDFMEYGLDLMFDGAYGKISGGNIVEKDDMYTYELDMYGDTISIKLENVTDLDFTTYESALSLCGVLVFDPAEQGFVFYAMEIKDTRMMFDNIAALLATEQTMDNSSQMWYLKNPVAVTCIVHEKGLFVEDATGALFLDQMDSIKTVAVGDSIVGVGGLYNPRQQMAAPQLTVDLADVTVVNSNNVLVPTEVTIAELLEEWNAIYTESAIASTWASRLVTIKDVTTALDPTDEQQRFGWFIQGTDSLFYSALMLNAAPGTNEWVTSYGYTFYNKMNLTGIVDYACLNPNYEYSFFPRSQADIVEVLEDAVEYATLTDLYVENGMIVTEGEFQIFTITGQNVTNMNGRLASGIYVVRTANAIGKVVIR